MLLICGEALFDVFMTDEEGLEAVAFTARVGGSPLNVAIGVRRLGVDCALLTGLSNDLFGVRLERLLQSESVNTQYVVRSARRTTLSFVGLDEAGSPSYSFYGAQSADCSLTVQDMPQLDASITGLHFGSYSIAVTPVADAFATLAARNHHLFISLDPNVRPNVEPDMQVWRRRVDALRRTATLIKVSDEDLSYLYPESDPLDVIGRWSESNLVVLTRGKHEIVALRGDEMLRVTPPSTSVVDTVGAGDAFQASLLAGLSEVSFAVNALSTEALRGMLETAAQAGAITCSRQGAEMPSRADLRQ